MDYFQPLSVNDVVCYLLENLSQQILNEVNLPFEVEGRIQLLRDHLRIQNAFLEVYEGRRNEHAVIREIVNQIRDASLEAEDIIETYIYTVNGREWWNLASQVKHSRMLHKTVSDIENIKLRIDEIKKKQQQYGVDFGHVNDEETQALADIEKRRRVVEEDDVVGFENNSLEVIDKLIRGRQQREIISIIGMGGLGKTTLARKIYNNNQVKEYFKCCAWTVVSNDPEPTQLLLNLLEQLMPKFNKISQDMNAEGLRKKLREKLKRKRYLVVLDDIWKPEVWEDIKDAFPDNQNGSRILITSRSNEDANKLSPCSLNQYSLPVLSQEKSWELFSKRVFQGEECPPDLEDLAKKMAEGCDGLPLSIVVLAGLMSRQERSRAQWSLMVGNENWHLSRPEHPCIKILALSYEYLPRRLKPCFLYIGLFPEDYEIHVRHLIRLWVAEGLIPKDTGNKQPEDVAEFYLHELINRNLIQIVKKRTNGGVKTCRIHDLLRMFCIDDEYKKDNFCEVFPCNNSTPTKSRRLALYCKISSYLSPSRHTNHSSVRSLFCFAQDQSTRYWKSLVKVFRLVRVLDVSRTSICSIPKSVRKLIHLRYLRIESDRIDLTISKYICELWNLETLDVRGSRLSALPGRIRKLKRLRHILMYGAVKMPRLNEPFETLQSLSTIALEDNTGSLFSEALFPKLRKLGLCFNRKLRWTPDDFWSTLQKLSELQTLKIIGTNLLPQNVGLFPPKLIKITLVNVTEHAMQILGPIPNLEILKISGRPNGPDPNIKIDCKIDCKNGEFKNLRVFQMRYLPCVNWTLDKGAMPRLQSLVIDNCYKLERLPNELWLLANLRDVLVSSPSPTLVESLRRLEMKDGCKLTILNENMIGFNNNWYFFYYP